MAQEKDTEASAKPKATSHKPFAAARPSDETRPARGLADVEEGREPTSEERRGIA